MHARTLSWDGCLNARDLGGHPTEDGGETQFRRVVRSDSLRHLSDEGWRALVDYGVGRIVDLRYHSELADDPRDRIEVDVVHVPLSGDSYEDLAEVDELLPDVYDHVGRTRTFYLELLERFSDRFAQAILAIADAPPGPVVVHCVGGKDRTGLVCALLLRLAGVAPEAVAADYAESEANLGAWLTDWVEAADDEEERAARAAIAATPADAMLGVLDELDRRHGGVQGYLAAAGVDDERLERLRARLRD
jgi:protein-tyrosine phosphatase